MKLEIIVPLNGEKIGSDCSSPSPRSHSITIEISLAEKDMVLTSDLEVSRAPQNEQL